MKRKTVLLAGFLVAIAVVVFLLVPASPVAVVKNGSNVPISVRIETDVGETYPIGTVAAGESTRVSITGRDKELWAVAQFQDGRIIQSRQIYTTTQGTVSILVTSDAVKMGYELKGPTRHGYIR